MAEDNYKAVLEQQNSEYKEAYGFTEKVEYAHITKKGLTEDTVREISKIKEEPEWMLEKRLQGYRVFMSKPTPMWGGDLSGINYDDIYYYMKPGGTKTDSWDKVPDDIKRTFDKLGIPEAERKFFSGAEAQFDSEVVYHHVREDLERQGVIFTDTDTAVKKYPEIMKKYFGTIIPPSDNKFAALNTAVWSGGSFIYVPKGVKVAMPLQAYFRINAEKAGQFERTLIIADEGAEVVYIEGCFVAGTEIVTEEGLKPIEEVKVGDRVFTHARRYRTVYHTQVRPHTGKLYSIKYDGDTTAVIKATDEHPFLVARRKKQEYTNVKWETEWVRADQLKKSDYLAIPIDNTTKTADYREFPIRMRTRWKTESIQLTLNTDADFFRLIGYYLSGGRITSVKGDSYLTFTFNKNEIDCVLDTATLLERYFGKKPLVQKVYKNGISIVLCSTLAARFFKQQFGKGAKNKRIPLWALNERTEKQKELIVGMWRGDGSFMNKDYDYGNKKMFRINTISEVLAKQLKSILLRMHIFSSVNTQKRTGNRNTMYCVYIGGDNVVRFANLMGTLTTSSIDTGNTKMLVSLENVITTSSRTRIFENYAFVPITEITSETVENLPVYNFSVEEDESYVAGGVAVHNCTAPIYMSSSLHSAVVELVAHKNSSIRYITIQNWSKNVYNLVTQRAFAYDGARVSWIDGNIGSRLNMKYPSVYLKGEGASGEVLSIAVAGEGQTQDSGGKIYHLAPNTTSKIVSKSVSKGTGVASYRGLLYISKDAANVKSNVRCDALLLDETAKTNTYPYMQVYRDDATITHEATVGKIGEEQLFYLMSRGMSEDDAIATIVLGFIEDLAKVLPMEYSIELKRLIKLDTSNSVG